VIRVALAVLLALALAGAALPAVDTARNERAADAARATADDLAAAVATLVAANDPTPPGVPGASATVTLTVADRVTLFIGGEVSERAGEDAGDGTEKGAIEDGSAVAYLVPGGERRTRSLPAPVRTPATENDSLTLRETTTLRLTYDRTESGPAVSVTRVAEV